MVSAPSDEEGIARGLSDASAAGGKFAHIPVLLQETVAALRPGPGKLILDCTLGGGGHARALLEAGACVVGFDQDPAAILHASRQLACYGERFRSVAASFGDLGAVLDRLGISKVDGALMDLGVSSHQLDTPSRGFSFQAEGPLDMRMNPNAAVTARALVNTASVEQLERIFREFGEEPQARRIASRLVRDRAVHSIDTTLDLARSVESVVPRRGKAHPATRVFQALRIAVNRELEVLSRGLELLSQRLFAGGRLAVITFHSLEDRIVKHFFQYRSTPTLDRPDWSAPRPNPEWIFCKVTGKPLTASDDELKANPRARSAKLRVVERVVEPGSGRGSPPGSPP